MKCHGIEMSRLKEPVEEILVNVYALNGWEITFKPLSDKNKYLLFIKEKEEQKHVSSEKKFKYSFRLKENS